MTLDEYQKLAIRTGRPPGSKDELYHLALGLVGETGEIAEKLKKLIRDKDSDESQLDIDDMAKELGDVLWYVAGLADYFKLSLDAVGDKNIAKLADRAKRGKIKGSGDNR
jgi:NTP pyrophosphatase (non-canonical NTP hydrolase)